MFDKECNSRSTSDDLKTKMIRARWKFTASAFDNGFILWIRLRLCKIRMNHVKVPLIPATIKRTPE